MAKEVELQVKIIAMTMDAERICAAAARQCYSPGNAVEIYHQITSQQVSDTLAHCIRSGHLAVLSAASATVAINVTRECLTQLNTHAFVKTVTQSQQYVNHRDFGYHVVDPYREDLEQLDRFVWFMDLVQKEYNWHRDKFIGRGYTAEQANEYARMCLTNANEANIVLSANFWGWYTWLNRRACNRNTFTTLKLSTRILKLFRENWPLIFGRCGPDCQLHGCTEGKPCGDPYHGRVI